jgi:hypothetical protein
MEGDAMSLNNFALPKIPGLTVTVNMAKGSFFATANIDRPMVVREVGRKMAAVLNHFGGLVRKIARNSIKRRKKSSQPGDPPSSHTGLLKKFIFYTFDRVRKSVIVGPVKLNARSALNLGANVRTIPETLEYGGNVVRTEYLSKITGTWKPLTSSHSAKRVARWGRPTRKRTVTIAPRPYMNPAFNVALPRLPAIAAEHKFTNLSALI